MVGVTKIGRANANYWIEAVAEGGEDYYTKPGEAPGEWMGELAAELGLDGEVDRDAYAAVLAGKHPGTGEVLVPRPEAAQVRRRRGPRAPPRPDPRLRRPLRRAEVGLAALRGRLARGPRRDPARPRPRRRRGGLLPGAHACFVQRGKGGVRIEPGVGLPRDGLPPPLLARRRPRPPHPPRHRQHDPRRLRRALAQPRRAEGPLAASGARRRPPATSTRRRFAPASPASWAAEWQAVRQRLRRPGRHRAAGDRALLPAAGARSSRRWPSAAPAPPRPPKSPPTAPATPRTTASTPTPSARSGSRARRSST